MTEKGVPRAITVEELERMLNGICPLCHETAPDAIIDDIDARLLWMAQHQWASHQLVMEGFDTETGMWGGQESQ